MSISLNGNNVLQTGNQVQPFAVTSAGALSFTGDIGGTGVNPLQLKNSALRSILDQHYANLLTESFSQITMRFTSRSNSLASNFCNSAHCPLSTGAMRWSASTFASFK